MRDPVTTITSLSPGAAAGSAGVAVAAGGSTVWAVTWAEIASDTITVDAIRQSRRGRLDIEIPLLFGATPARRTLVGMALIAWR